MGLGQDSIIANMNMFIAAGRNIREKDEKEARARLNEAAPELLASLESLVTAIDSGITTETLIGCGEHGENSCLGNARAAIAKAKGI